jgi:hypothetical protein
MFAIQMLFSDSLGIIHQYFVKNFDTLSQCQGYIETSYWGIYLKWIWLWSRGHGLQMGTIACVYNGV